jgi:hypothetical protein
MSLLQRFAAIGALPDEREDDRIRRGALTIAAGVDDVGHRPGNEAEVHTFGSGESDGLEG